MPTRGSVVDLWRYRSLTWNFAQREIKGKYKGSVLGWGWSLLSPLATIVIFSFVFATVFRAEPPPFGSGREGLYAVWLFVGLVAWNFFNGTVQTSMTSLIGAGPLLKKIYFPPFTPVLGGVVAALWQTAIESVLLLVVLAALGNVGWTMLLLPLVVALLAVFAAGLALLLALLNVRFRDVAYLVSILLQMLFYLTPIIYPPTLVPERALGLPLRDLLLVNPLAQYVGAVRDVVYDLEVPSAGRFGWMAGAAIVSLAIGWTAFSRGARDVIEEL